jgi:hypothetical protein
MKRLIALLCAILLMFASSAMAELQEITLEPGMYEIGKDIEAGKWELGFVKSDFSIRLDYGRFDAEENPDISYPYFFSASFMMKWNQNPKLTVYLLDGDFLKVSFSSCTLYRDVPQK